MSRRAGHDVVEVLGAQQVAAVEVHEQRVAQRRDRMLTRYPGGCAAHSVGRTPAEIASQINVVDAVVHDIEVPQAPPPAVWMVLPGPPHVGHAVKRATDAAVDQHLDGAMGGRPTRLLVDHQRHTRLLGAMNHPLSGRPIHGERFLREDRLACRRDLGENLRSHVGVHGQVHHLDLWIVQQHGEVRTAPWDAPAAPDGFDRLGIDVHAGDHFVAEVTVGGEVGRIGDGAAAHDADLEPPPGRRLGGIVVRLQVQLVETHTKPPSGAAQPCIPCHAGGSAKHT